MTHITTAQTALGLLLCETIAGVAQASSDVGSIEFEELTELRGKTMHEMLASAVWLWRDVVPILGYLQLKAGALLESQCVREKSVITANGLSLRPSEVSCLAQQLNRQVVAINASIVHYLSGVCCQFCIQRLLRDGRACFVLATATTCTSSTAST